MHLFVCILEIFVDVSDAYWSAGIQIVLSYSELECNPAGQLMQVYVFYLDCYQHFFLPFLFSFDVDVWLIKMQECENSQWSTQALTRMHGHTVLTVHVLGLTETQRAGSSFPLSLQCVQLVLCWLERLKHLADSTLRAGENVSAWLSAWCCKTKERGKLGQGHEVCVGYCTWFDCYQPIE